MKACPNCYLSFNDGYICPHCRGQLVDYNPDQQSQASPYQSQGAAYQAQQSYYDAPSQQSQSMQSSPAQVQYSQPAPQPQYQQPTNNFPPTIIKKRTGLVVFLVLLLLALGAFAGYLVYEEYQERTKPTDLETQVVKSAWDWYTSVEGMFATVEEMNPAEQQTGGIPERGTESKSARSGSGASVGANAAGDQPAGELDADMTAGATPGDGENAAAAAESPQASATSPEDAASVHNSDVVANNATNADSNTEAGASGAAAPVDAAALTESMKELNASIDEMMVATMALALLSNDDYIKTVDGPMQSLKEKFPDLVGSWDGMKSALGSDMSNMDEFRLAAQKFRQAGESFKRAAEKYGFDTANWSN